MLRFQRKCTISISWINLIILTNPHPKGWRVNPKFSFITLTPAEVIFQCLKVPRPFSVQCFQCLPSLLRATVQALPSSPGFSGPLLPGSWNLAWQTTWRPVTGELDTCALTPDRACSMSLPAPPQATLPSGGDHSLSASGQVARPANPLPHPRPPTMDHFASRRAAPEASSLAIPS